MKFLKYSIIVLIALSLAAMGLVSCGSGGTLTSIKIDQADPTSITFSTATTQQFTVTATLSDGSTWANWPLVDWSSSNANVSIDVNGLATASVAPPPGYSSTITANAQGHSGIQPSSITLNVN